LPNLFGLVTFSIPLLTNNFGNVGVVEIRIASNDGLLVMLPIKDKSYKEISGCPGSANKECFLCSTEVTPSYLWHEQQ
jgi:hypothetical protein